MFLISIIKTEYIVKFTSHLFIISLILLALVPIIGIEVKGAKRWLDLYFFRLQPIEILKPLFILITVKILTFEKLKDTQIKYFFKLYFVKFSYNFINRSTRFRTINIDNRKLGCYSFYIWS